ncbi:MAG: S1 RNA-binding domain-containing protein, partial [Holophagaceae bacterium]
TKKSKSAKCMVYIGDQVEAVILGIDFDNRRISLGMKQITTNPWLELAEKYKPGMSVTGTVRNITEFGAFVELEEGFDGLVHVSDFSWTKKIKHPGEVVKKGDSLTAQVLSLDPEAQRLSLGVKQLEPNDCEIFFNAHHVGDVLTAPIVRLTDFGAFIDLGSGIEGLVHVTELSENSVQDINTEFQIGQELTMKIVKLDPEEHRIGLSVKQMKEGSTSSPTEDENAKLRLEPFKKPTLGDAFKELDL